jgi:putative transposase
VKNDAPIDEKKQEQETPKSLLEELIREGARRLLQAAIEQEVTEYLERFREEKDDKGHQMVVRNGRLPERMFVTGVGPLRIHQPRIRDKREGETFTSTILPRYLRRVPTIDTLLHVLYQKGISTGDMMPALEALLGPHTLGLSATNIVRLKRVWETEYREWTKRDL